MRCLISGCAGFVGSNLARRLINEGHEVIGIDNLSHGLYRNIEGLDMQFIMANLANKHVLSLLSELSFDVCIHLASEKIPRYDDAFSTLSNNHEMLSNVIARCQYNGAKLLFASTSDVYGKNPNVPFSEEADLTLGPTTVKRWAYATSKIHSEQYIHACASHYGLKYVIMRFFSAYGPNQNTTWWGGPQGVFIDNMIRKVPIDIHGDGQQQRCFTYIDDLVDGIMLCLGQENDIYNIGNPNSETTIEGLALKIAEILGLDGLRPQINYVPYAQFGKYEDVRRRIPDITKLKALGYDPQTGLDEGLKKTIEWQKNLQ